MNLENLSISGSCNLSTNGTTNYIRSRFNSSQSSKEPASTSKLNFLPFRLKDLTQEILDSENEPIKKVPIVELDTEESNNQFIETPTKVVSEQIINTSPLIDPVKLFTSTPRILVNDKEFVPPIFKSRQTGRLLNCALKAPISTPNVRGTSNANVLKILSQTELKTNKSLTVLQDQNKENVIKRKSQFSLTISVADMKGISVNNVNYLILNQLGRGGSSVVYHCYNTDTKTERAIKQVNLESDTNSVGYINEVNVLAKLQNCSRIIKMYDNEYIKSEKVLLIVLEKGETDLSTIIKRFKNSKEHLPLHTILNYWMEMLYAVREIHENGIIHADLKPANFLQVKGGLKLIDFGIALWMQDNVTSVARTCQIGSFDYISPEALTNQSSNDHNSPNFGKPKYKIKFKTDVWSLGCIFYQLIYQKTPFQHIEHMWAKLSVIMDPSHTIDYPVLEWVPEKIINTIKRCLQYNVQTRPSINELIKEYQVNYFSYCHN